MENNWTLYFKILYLLFLFLFLRLQLNSNHPLHFYHPYLLTFVYLFHLYILPDIFYVGFCPLPNLPTLSSVLGLKYILLFTPIYRVTCFNDYICHSQHF